MAAPTANRLLWIPVSRFAADGTVATYSGTEVEGYPISNLLDPNPTKTFRSQVGKGCSFTIGRTSGTPTINCFAFVNHNLAVGDVIGALGWNLEPLFGWNFWPITGDDAGNAHPVQVFYTTADSPYKYWSFVINTAASQYVEIGVVFCGVYQQIPVGVLDGMDIEELDPSVGSADDGRQGYWKRRTQFKRFSFDLAMMNEARMDAWLDTYREVGTSHPFVVMFDPVNDKSHTYYVQFTSQMSRQRGVANQFRMGRFSLEEKF